MSIYNIILLVLIGVGAGMLSGFIGIGGGIVIVPALVYFMSLTQHQAQGTSLFVLAFPVVILGLMNYWKQNNVNWQFGLIIALGFVIGGYFGSKLALKLNPSVLKLFFGILMAFVSFRLILSGYNSFQNGE